MIATVRGRLTEELRGRLQSHRRALRQLDADDIERMLHERAVTVLRPVLSFVGTLSGSDARLARLEMLDPTGGLPIRPGSAAAEVMDRLEDRGEPGVPTIWLDRFVDAYHQDMAGFRIF